MSSSVPTGRASSVGFVPSVLYARLPEIIRGFRRAAPEVDLTLTEMVTIEQIAALKEGRIDFGFGRVRFDDPAIEREVLREEELVAALPIGHRLLSGDRPIRSCRSLPRGGDHLSA